MRLCLLRLPWVATPSACRARRVAAGAVFGFFCLFSGSSASCRGSVAVVRRCSRREMAEAVAGPGQAGSASPPANPPGGAGRRAARDVGRPPWPRRGRRVVLGVSRAGRVSIFGLHLYRSQVSDFLAGDRSWAFLSRRVTAGVSTGPGVSVFSYISPDVTTSPQM